MALRFPLLGLLLLCLFATAWTDSCDDDTPEKHWDEKEMDTAWLTFLHNNHSSASEYSITFLSDNCYKCDPIVAFMGNETRRVKVSSQFKWTITLRHSTPSDPNSIILDEVRFGFREYGRYELSFEPGVPGAKFKLDVKDQGMLSMLPIIVALSICVGLAFIYKLLLVLIKRRRNHEMDSEPPFSAPKHHVKPRLRSLDAFRGLSLFLMVFVNYGGGGYWYFNHASWNGITFADLLFPWFVWIMGAAMPFAFAAAEKKKEPKLMQFVHLVRRSLTLVALGMFLNNGHFLNYWRLPGVLQRFGLAYFAIGTLYMFIPKLGAKKKKDRPLLAESSSEADMHINAVDDDTIQRNAQSFSASSNDSSSMPACLVDHFSDIFPFLFEYLVVFILILIWFLLTFLLPVPGCPKGYLGPGGLTGNPHCTGGAAGYIDRVIFGLRHIYHHPTCSDSGPGDIPQNYGCEAYDPEGLLGNLTSIFLCYLGLQAGRIMKTYQTHRARFLRLCIHGLVWAAVGTGLCGASQNTGLIPLNKNLWSFSFVALLGGLAFWLLAFCFVLIDWIRIWKGGPFTYVGMNSIIVYMGHELLGEFFPFSWSWKSPGTRSGEFSNHWTATTSNLCGASMWLIIAYILFKKKIFIRV